MVTIFFLIWKQQRHIAQMSLTCESGGNHPETNLKYHLSLVCSFLRTCLLALVFLMLPVLS